MECTYCVCAAGMPWERTPYCELTYGHPTLGAALYLAMESAPGPANSSSGDMSSGGGVISSSSSTNGGANSSGFSGSSSSASGSWVYPEGYCGKVCVSAYRPQALSEPLYWSVPWTATVHLTPQSGRTPPWVSAHTRRVLVSFCAATYPSSASKPILS